MVETLRFIFIQIMEALGLAFLGLLTAKAVGKLGTRDPGQGTARVRWVRGVLYVLILLLIIVGARNLGYTVAARIYMWASQDELGRGQFPRAYEYALRAVRLRPGVLSYWQVLADAKLAERQYASLLEDLPAFESLSHGELDERDAYRFAVCHYFLGEYDKVILSTQRLIHRNRYYSAPSILRGMAYLAQKKYGEAERSFLVVLDVFPNNQPAVEGLAQAFFLEGNRARAVAVLNETTKYAFPPDARKEFEALKALYGK